MSSVTLLDYSVVNVRVVDLQHAVMMCDMEQTENCINEAPLTCDPRFRFLLRPFGTSVETAPTGRFPHFTRSNGGNSDTFNKGPGGFLALLNPFTITNTTEWTVSLTY